MLRHLALVAGLAGATLFAGPDLSAQANGNPFALTVDSHVSIGDSFDMCIDAPQGWIVVLLLSAGDGPTPSPYGPLALDLPFLWDFAFVMPPGGPLCFPPHDVPCDPSLVGVVGHFQFLTADMANPGFVGLSNPASLEVVDDGLCSGNDSFVTFTQGGWGTNCHGNNPGCLRDAHFAGAFPAGLLVGDPDGIDADGVRALVLTSSAAVAAFLPSGGPPKALTANELNPGSSSAGVLAGQLVAATLSVGFDDAGVFDGSKTNPTHKLRDQVFVGCVDSDLLGFSVGQLLDLANVVISGGALPPGVSVSNISDALTALNENYDNGTQNNGCLALTGP